MKVHLILALHELAPEMIKWMGGKENEWRYVILKQVWGTERIPKILGNNVIIAIQKNGDQSPCGKLYTRILEVEKIS